MTLADQIINHEPWNPDQLAQLNATGADLNALRDELLEGRRLRTVGEARCHSCDHTAAMHHDDGCWRSVLTGTIGRHLVCPCTVPLAELLRRADQHREECR